MAEGLNAKFRENALKHPDRVAIESKEDGRWTKISYGELNKRIESFAAHLLKRGIGKGDRVAIVLENGPEWPVIFFAVVSIGAVAVPIDPEADRETKDSILKDSGCKIVFSNDSYPVRPTRSENSDLVGLTGVGLHDTACMLYTSGTTDEPKAVMLSHGNLLSNEASIRKLEILTAKDKVVSVLPLHHAYSLTTTMLLPLFCGAEIVYPGSIRGEVITEAMRQVNPNLFMVVPEILYLFRDKIMEKFEKIPFPISLAVRAIVDFLYVIRSKTGINLARCIFLGIHKKFGNSLRMFVSGGAKLDVKAAADLIKLGFTVLEGYGLTETSPVLTFNPLKKPKIGSAGRPIPAVRIEICGKNEEGVGEVLARGPNIMKGYYRRPDLTAKVIKNGWFHTGDLGYIDEDGYLFLTGRLKDVIVMSSGLNIYPADIEEVYEKAPSVKEICVFETSRKVGKKETNILWAAIAPDIDYFHKHNEMNLREVLKANIELISRRMPACKRVMGFTVTLDKLPRTPLGKVKRYLIKDLYSSEISEKDGLEAKKELTEDEKRFMEKPVSKSIASCLKKETGVSDIRPQDTLELDLGIDSLKRIELAAAFEKRLGVGIKDESVWRAFTVKDLITAAETCLMEDVKHSAFSEDKKFFDPDEWGEILRIPPKKENKEKIDFCPGPRARLLSLVFDLTFGFMLKMFFNLKAEGLENIPDKGPYILFANHTSYFDPLIIVSSLSTRQRLDLFFIGFKALFELPVVRRLIVTARLIPLNFTTHFLEALKSCYYILKNGKNLCIFPEGMRSFGPKLCEFKKGFGILAKETGVKLLPVFIQGAFEAWPRTATLPKRYPIKVKFGKCLNAEELKKEGFKMGAGDNYTAICLAARKALIAVGKSLKDR